MPSAAKRLVVAAVVAALSTCIGCSVHASGRSDSYQSASSAVPAETTEDLVTYGDVAVMFRVTAESEIAPSQEERDRGEGTITRQVSVQQSGKVLWTRPTRGATAAKPDSHWEIADGGWVFHGNRRTPLGEEKLKVGQTYLAVRTFSSFGDGTDAEWFSLCYFLVQDGKVEINGSSVTQKSFHGFSGSTVASVVARLSATKPDPKTLPYMNLDAVHRYQKSFE